MQKKFLLLLLCSGIIIAGNAQMGVGTTTPNSTLDVRGSLSTGFRAFTANTTATASDNLLVFTGTIAATLTLPDAGPCIGRTYWIKTAVSSPLTINTTAAQTIDGLPTWPMSTPNKTLKVVSNGANWVVAAETLPGSGGPAAAWTPGGNPFATPQNLGTTTDTDIPFITNKVERMRLHSDGRLEIGSNTSGSTTAITTRSATSVAAFPTASYGDYNGGVIQSTYPGGLTGQILNISAAGANAGNWPSNIAFWTRTNGGTNATEKMRLSNGGRLDLGSASTGPNVAITLRTATTVNTFPAATYADYNGGVLQSTYPGGLTGQILNIAAAGANAGNWPSNIAFWTRTNGGTNSTEKMRLTNGGRLEVGSASTGAGVAITLRTATSVATFPTSTYGDYNGGVLQSTYPGGLTGQILNISATGSNAGNWPSNIAFWTRINGGTNAVERMRISDDGFVGIGCTSPNYRLQVVGDIAASGGTLRAASAVISTSISACSDIRYKKDIAPIGNALNNVMKLQGVSYNWKTEEFPDNYFTTKHQLGIIAQELEKIYPELVETDAKGYKTVDYSKMAPVLIEAIKEQQRQLTAQQAQINSLKNDIDEIKKAIAANKK